MKSAPSSKEVCASVGVSEPEKIGLSALLHQAMTSGFEEGTLRPFPVNPASTFTLEQAADAYRKVLSGSPERLAFVPHPS